MLERLPQPSTHAHRHAVSYPSRVVGLSADGLLLIGTNPTEGYQREAEEPMRIVLIAATHSFLTVTRASAAAKESGFMVAWSLAQSWKQFKR
jgi:hypothetical protein